MEWGFLQTRFFRVSRCEDLIWSLEGIRHKKEFVATFGGSKSARNLANTIPVQKTTGAPPVSSSRYSSNIYESCFGHLPSFFLYTQYSRDEHLRATKPEMRESGMMSRQLRCLVEMDAVQQHNMWQDAGDRVTKFIQEIESIQVFY
ncbi:MAG: hypothetical protein ONB44_21090 [candidate division KSB1 bacterium]|nr:hypothetical protein [candidate division KSB1 bacterium]MDZ7304630.1 hypothetical protein [candidate division KSB1 bacterium]MDZ7313762.1 hypothetical protein [candidate division KSB1 bacterium]